MLGLYFVFCVLSVVDQFPPAISIFGVVFFISTHPLDIVLLLVLLSFRNYLEQPLLAQFLLFSHSLDALLTGFEDQAVFLLIFRRDGLSRLVELDRLFVFF